MKKDLYFIILILALFVPFVVSKELYNAYTSFNHEHGLIMAFVKFSVLATFGEMIGLRIKTGNYYTPTFGLWSRMLVWGLLGITIKIAFVIFAKGTPIFMEYLGFEGASEAMRSTFTMTKLLTAAAISIAMNLIYAPVMMTLHRITDFHIEETQGRFLHFFQNWNFTKYFNRINWDVQWNFVFKKTIPFFWIPAHTLTFLMPPDFQVLFAALLGIILGIILAVASKMN